MFLKRRPPQPAHIRPARRSDYWAIQRLLGEHRAAHTRVVPEVLKQKLELLPGYVLEDDIGVCGFLIIENQTADMALILATAFHNRIDADAGLDRLLPVIEREAEAARLKALMQAGDAQWLNQALQKRGFTVQEQVITFEWRRQALPALVPHPQLQLRTATLEDLPTLLVLDSLAFDMLWRKPHSAFREALSQAASFRVGCIGGKVIAYEWCEQYSGHAHLTRLATHPDFQGQGIGGHLLYRALEDVMLLNVRTVSLNTQRSNVRSQRLYERFGFRQTHQVVDVLLKDLGETSAGA